MQYRKVVCGGALVMFASLAPAWAGAPTPDIRDEDFQHVCKGGPNKDDPCTVATAATDCPKSSCILKVVTGTFKGVLTLIMDESVVDWNQQTSGPQALTALLEVKKDGVKTVLAETYQNLTDPTQPPTAITDVVSVDITEQLLVDSAAALSGLRLLQPDSALAQALRTLFAATGTPVIVDVKEKSQLTDQTATGLGTVLRFKIKFQFIEPL